jgi:hypothetical protein
VCKETETETINGLQKEGGNLSWMEALCPAEKSGKSDLRGGLIPRASNNETQPGNLRSFWHFLTVARSVNSQSSDVRVDA